MDNKASITLKKWENFVLQIDTAVLIISGLPKWQIIKSFR